MHSWHPFGTAWSHDGQQRLEAFELLQVLPPMHMFLQSPSPILEWSLRLPILPCSLSPCHFHLASTWCQTCSSWVSPPMSKLDSSQSYLALLAWPSPNPHLQVPFLPWEAPKRKQTSNIDNNLLNVKESIPPFVDSQGCCQWDDPIVWFALALDTHGLLFIFWIFIIILLKYGL